MNIIIAFMLQNRSNILTCGYNTVSALLLRNLKKKKIMIM